LHAAFVPLSMPSRLQVIAVRHGQLASSAETRAMGAAVARTTTTTTTSARREGGDRGERRARRVRVLIPRTETRLRL
jgi:hypothetical protein